MALIWADGFNHWGSSANFIGGGNYSELNAAGVILNTGARTDTYCVAQTYFGAGAGWLSKFIGGNRTSLGFGIAVNYPIFPSGREMGVAFQDATNQFQVSITVQPDGSLQVRQGQNGTLLGATDPGVIAVGSYAFIEAFCICDTVNGAVAVQVNGSPAVAIEGVNTNPVGSGFINSVAFGKINGGENSTPLYNDFIIWDTTTARNNMFFGDIRCRTILPIANGAAQDWAPSAGSAFDCVNNVPPTGANISADAADQIASFALATIPTNTSTVFAVALFTRAAKSDAGTCVVSPQLKSGTAVVAGTDISPGVGGGYYSSVFATDPDGGGSWSLASVNALLAQVERTA